MSKYYGLIKQWMAIVTLLIIFILPFTHIQNFNCEESDDLNGL